jgi:hypothetical protein
VIVAVLHVVLAVVYLFVGCGHAVMQDQQEYVDFIENENWETVCVFGGCDHECVQWL